MDDFDNDMGLPDDEMIGESAGDISDLGAELERERGLGGEAAASSRGSSGGARPRVAERAATVPKPKAAAKPKASTRSKAKTKKKKAAKAAKKKARPAKKGKARAKKRVGRKKK